MRTILLALIWCMGLVETVTTRSDGDDNRAGQMLQVELEAGDLTTVAAEQETVDEVLPQMLRPIPQKLRIRRAVLLH